MHGARTFKLLKTDVQFNRVVLYMWVWKKLFLSFICLFILFVFVYKT